MVKSVFINPKNLSGIEDSNVNHLMVLLDGLSEEIWSSLKGLGCTLSISVNAFDRSNCPVDPVSKDKLFSRIDQALTFQPTQVWLDAFRFGGDCTDIENEDVNKAHQVCAYCQGLNRQEFINQLAEQIVARIGGKSEVGYFAVAFKDEEVPDLARELGLNYKSLGSIFDLSSPMLYHRMIKRPVGYISEYIKWLSEKTNKPVLPIIQLKDMPDDLLDNLTEEEIEQSFNEAKKDPSIGVAFFYWSHALEKNKSEIISRLFK